MKRALFAKQILLKYIVTGLIGFLTLSTNVDIEQFYPSAVGRNILRVASDTVKCNDQRLQNLLKLHINAELLSPRKC